VNKGLEKKKELRQIEASGGNLIIDEIKVPGRRQKRDRTKREKTAVN